MNYVKNQSIPITLYSIFPSKCNKKKTKCIFASVRATHSQKMCLLFLIFFSFYWLNTHAGGTSICVHCTVDTHTKQKIRNLARLSAKMLTEAEEQRRVAGQEEMPWSAGAMAVGAGGPKGSTGPANGPGGWRGFTVCAASVFQLM